MAVPKVGDRVRYHGSKTSAYGTYRIIAVPPEPALRGYVLALDEENRDEPHIYHVHRDSFTVLVDELEEGKKLAIEDWSDDEIQDYLDYLPEFLGAINDGVYDKHLAEIAKACFARRDILKGTETPGLKAALAHPPADVLVPTYIGRVLGEGGNLVKPVRQVHRAILVEGMGGRRYSKDDLTGRYLRLKNPPMPFYLGDVLVEITSVGNQFLTVTTREDPKVRYPSSTELKKKNVGVGYSIKVAPDQILHIFG